MILPREVVDLMVTSRVGNGRVVALTGAGISDESGIPTFRGPEGYWRIGSRNYFPEELATLRAFRNMPHEVWSWYLYRRAVCRGAEPNAAHHALAELDSTLGDDFVLITQNVDGLHLRAGSSHDRTYQIHGNLDFVRCAEDCSNTILPFPRAIGESWERGRQLEHAEARALHCGDCGGWLRPHVLWFDECYDEDRYRFESSLQAADQASMLVVVGTSGTTNLPVQVCEKVHRRGVPMLVVNKDPSPFTTMVADSAVGYFAQGSAVSWLPPIARQLQELARGE